MWPTEEYELALSHVETDDDEDDLFAGIPAEVAAADALATRADLPLVRDDRIAPTVEFHV